MSSATEKVTQVEVEESHGGHYMQSIHSGDHVLIADEPVDQGGNDAGPDPYSYLLAALGACTSMTLRMYADRKEIPLKNVKVRLSHNKIHAKDCADCEKKEGMVDCVRREIELDGDLTEAQAERLLEIANRCPVHQTLTSAMHIKSCLSPGWESRPWDAEGG